MINGINNQTMEAGFANGMGCLAAQYVAAHKCKIGGFYLTSHDNKQGYDYEVRFKDGQFVIKVGEFEGTPDELLVYREDEE